MDFSTGLQSESASDADFRLLHVLSLPIDFLTSCVRNRHEVEILLKISSSAAALDNLSKGYEMIAIRTQALQEAWGALWRAQEPFVVPAIPLIGKEMSGANQARGILLKKLNNEIQNLQELGKMLLYFIDVNSSVAKELQMEGICHLALDKSLLVEVEQELVNRIEHICSHGTSRHFSSMPQFILGLHDKCPSSKSVLDRNLHNDGKAIDSCTSQDSADLRHFIIEKCECDSQKDPTGALSVKSNLIASQGSWRNSVKDWILSSNDKFVCKSTSGTTSTNGSVLNVDHLFPLLNNSSSVSEERLPRQPERGLDALSQKSPNQGKDIWSTYIKSALLTHNCVANSAEQLVENTEMDIEKENTKQSMAAVDICGQEIKGENVDLVVGFTARCDIQETSTCSLHVADNKTMQAPSIQCCIDLTGQEDKLNEMEGCMLTNHAPATDANCTEEGLDTQKNMEPKSSDMVMSAKYSLREFFSARDSIGVSTESDKEKVKRFPTGAVSEEETISPFEIKSFDSKGISVSQTSKKFKELDFGNRNVAYSSPLDIEMLGRTCESSLGFCIGNHQMHDTSSRGQPASRLFPLSMVEVNHLSQENSSTKSPGTWNLPLKNKQTRDNIPAGNSLGSEDSLEKIVSDPFASNLAKNSDLPESPILATQ
eukprot:c22230_g1_i1 orf=137-2101(+)